MQPVSMGELGVIAYYLKLEPMVDKSSNRNNGIRKEKERERIKQPLFQFRYDGYNGKFIRELKENA